MADPTELRSDPPAGLIMPLSAEIAVLRGFFTPEEDGAWKQSSFASGGGLSAICCICCLCCHVALL